MKEEILLCHVALVKQYTSPMQIMDVKIGQHALIREYFQHIAIL